MTSHRTLGIGVIAAIVAIAALAFVLVSPHSHGNQSSFCPSQLNATTSPAYMTAGTGTSTLPTACGDGSTALDGAILTWQVTSSSTPPTINVRPEVSRDGIDWYPIEQALNLNASTTREVAGVVDYQWIALASTTGDMAGTGVASTSAGTPVALRGTRYHGSLAIPVTEPYVRVKISVPVGSPAVSLSAEIVAKREQLAR